MVRIRKILFAALIVSIAVLVGTQFPIFRETHFLIIHGLQILAALYASAIIILLLFSFFPADDVQDPWDSAYFKFMRSCWGESWGGSHKYYDNTQEKYFSRALQISPCRATFLSSVTLGVFFFMVAAFVGALYLDFLVAIGGMDGVRFLAGNHATIIELFSCFAVSQMAMLFITLLIGGLIFAEGVKKFSYDLYWWSVCSLWVALGIATAILFAATCYQIGVLKISMYGGAVVVAICLIALIVYIGIQGVKNLRQTIPAMLIREQVTAWKDKFCPLIVEGQNKVPTGIIELRWEEGGTDENEEE